MTLTRLKALHLLAECTGDDLWSVSHCRLRGVPDHWISELTDCFESGFDSDRNTIYLDDRVTNQFHGLRDIDLARKLADFLGVDCDSLEHRAMTRQQLVHLIKQAVEEG
ncbi:MAG: hypothetical protein KDB22_17330 [Planctomycetales bacterium]|nr:hypothetical protein [Planctomycetales bacterium]